MKSLLRALRGAIGTAIIWAFGWGATAAGLWTGAAMLLSRPFDARFWDTLWAVTGVGAVTGVVAGVFFAAVLATLHGGRSIEELSAGRVAFWGALAGIGVPGSIVTVASLLGGPMQPDVVLILLAGLGTAGALTGGGTIRIAQMTAGVGAEGGDAIRKPKKQAAVPSGDAPKAAPTSAPKSAPKPEATAPKSGPPADTGPAAPTKKELDAYDRRLEEALAEDPEIAKLLGDDPKTD